MEIPTTALHQTTNQVLVRTIHAQKAALAGDTDPSLLVGPFVAGDADTEAVLAHKIVPIPFPYVVIFLSQPDGVTPVSTLITSYLKLSLTVEIRCVYP